MPGYTDPVNNKSDYEITIDKDNEALLTMNYLRDNDLYGVLFKDIVGQYIVVENNNLKEFAKNLGVEDVSAIPDKIEIGKLTNNINYEEISNLFSKYLNTAIEVIPEDNYYKINKGDISLGDKTVQADGYGIELKVKDLQKILIEIFKQAKNDEQVYNQIVNITTQINKETALTFEEYQSSVDEFINSISTEISSEDNIKILDISVYKQGKDTVKLSIDISVEDTTNGQISIEKTSDGIKMIFSLVETSFDTKNEATIEITKTENSNEQESFECVISSKIGDEDPSNFNINLSRTGELTSNNVTFNLSIPLQLGNGVIANFELNNTTDFSAAPEIEEYAEGNHLVINKVPKEQLNNLFNNLGKLISEKLKNEAFINMMKNGGIEQLAQQASQETQNAIQQEQSSMSTMLKDTFNAQFEVYEGTRKGEEIKILINAINSSNQIDSEHTVTYSGVEENNLDVTKEYKVTLEKDNATGYINKVVVEEN